MNESSLENLNCVVLSERSHVKISGIASVDSFDELQISATTNKGECIVIDGSGMSIKDVNLDKGVLEAVGNIDGINYYDKNPVKRSAGFKGLFGIK